MTAFVYWAAGFWLAMAIFALLAALDMTFVRRWNISWGLNFHPSDFVGLSARQWALLPLQLIACVLIAPAWVLMLYLFPGQK